MNYMYGINTPDYQGIQFKAPSKGTIVHAFDFDDTITLKPANFDSSDLTKDQYFDLARRFTPDPGVTELLRMMHRWGDAIAICTARPIDRMTDTLNWLRQYHIPFDVIMLSKGTDVSGNVKQLMLKQLRKDYRMVGTLIDDSPFNIEGARLQRIKRIHVLKNCSYWEKNPEVVTKQ